MFPRPSPLLVHWTGIASPNWTVNGIDSTYSFNIPSISSSTHLSVSCTYLRPSFLVRPSQPGESIESVPL